MIATWDVSVSYPVLCCCSIFCCLVQFFILHRYLAHLWCSDNVSVMFQKKWLALWMYISDVRRQLFHGLDSNNSGQDFDAGAVISGTLEINCFQWFSSNIPDSECMKIIPDEFSKLLNKPTHGWKPFKLDKEIVITYFVVESSAVSIVPVVAARNVGEMLIFDRDCFSVSFCFVLRSTSFNSNHF